MKSINTRFETWETLAEAQLEGSKPFELLGFDLELPAHRAFWEKMKRTGKFHASIEPKVKVTFIPAGQN